MPKPLPPFQPVTQDQLRQLWTRHADQDVRRVILEVERYRRLLDEIDGYYETIQMTWNTMNGGHLIALYMLKMIVQNERWRLPKTKD